MKITKYNVILKEIKELSKEELKNARRLKELSEQLDNQKKLMDSISLSLIKEKLNNCDTYEEYNSLKNLLNEKKAYIKNEETIDNIIAGYYSSVNKKRKLTLRKGLTSLGIIGLCTTLGISLFSCTSKKKSKDNTIEGDTTSYNGKDANNNDKNNDNKTVNTDSNKENSNNTKDLNKENSKNNTNKDNKNNKDNKDNKDNSKNEPVKGLKPTDEVTITTNNSDKTKTVTGYTGKTVETILKEKVETNTEGRLPIEPSVTIIDNTKDSDKKDTYVEEKSTESLPPITKVEGNDEITHDIPKNTEGEKEYDKEDIDKKDTYVEEKNTESLPPLDVVEGNDEITYGNEPCNSVLPDEYEVIEETSYDLPSLDNVDESSYIEESKMENYTVTDFVESDTTTFEEINNYELPSLDNVDESEDLISEFNYEGKSYNLTFRK